MDTPARPGVEPTLSAHGESPPVPCLKLAITIGALTEAKRRKILMLVANGSSRRMAARWVGCAPSTITRTALRDPEFGRQLALAESRVEIEALRAIRAAAQQGRYWHAAAWLLERRNPRDFGRQSPKTLPAQEAAPMLTQIVESLREGIGATDDPRLHDAVEIVLKRLRQVHGEEELPDVQHPADD